MNLKEHWSVTYTYHTHDEKWNIKTVVILAENIGKALTAVDNTLAYEMEQNDWSDYYITAINIVPELH